MISSPLSFGCKWSPVSDLASSVSPSRASFSPLSSGRTLIIRLNAVSVHATCTVVWVVIVAVIAAAFGSIRTLDKISWLGWAGIVSIVGSVITLTVSVGVQDRPAAAPQTGPWVKEVIVAANPGFVDALNAVNTVVLSYGGVSAYVSVAGEMKHPREYAKAMFASHTFMTAVYLIISCVCYHYVGQYIASPVSFRYLPSTCASLPFASCSILIYRRSDRLVHS